MPRIHDLIGLLGAACSRTLSLGQHICVSIFLFSILERLPLFFFLGLVKKTHIAYNTFIYKAYECY